MLKLPTFRNLGRKRPQKETPSHFSLVDVGADTIKAAVVEARAGQVKVLGHSLLPTEGRDIAGGRTQAAKLTAAVNEALQAAEDLSEQATGRKIVPDHILYVLPERVSVGKRFTVKLKRSQPRQPISRAELDDLWNRALQLAKRRLPAQPGVAADWIPQTVTPAGLRLNGQVVNDPVGLQGETLALSIYGVISQPAIIRAFEQLSAHLEVEIYNIVPASQTLAGVVPARDALVFDVGAGGTNCSLIQDDALIAAERVPFGGQYFRRAMGEAFKTDLESAEALKIAFSSQALSSDDVHLVQRSLNAPLNRWAERVTEALDNLLKPKMQKQLPGSVYFAGGSAVLPGLKNRLLLKLKEKGYAFERSPEITNLGETPLSGFSAAPTGFRGILFALVLSLAKTV